MVFSPVPFQSDQLAAPSLPEQDDEQQQETIANLEGLQTKGMVATLQGIASKYLRRLLNPTDVSSCFVFLA